MEGNSIKLTRSEYNDVLKQLHACFESASDTLEALSEKTIISTPEERQELYTESAIDEAISTAILESYEDGPLFEAVTRKDKERIKSIVRTLRPKIEETLVKDKVSFYRPNLIARLIVGGLITAGGIAAGGVAGKAILGGAAGLAKGAIASKAIPVAGQAIGAHLAAGAATKVAAGAAGAAAAGVAGAKGAKTAISGIQQVLQTRLWQVIGVVHVEDANINSLCNQLTEKFAETLGEYKIISLKSIPTIHDAFKTHFGWKDQRKSYFLLVDRKLDSELAKLNDGIVSDSEEYTDVVGK